MDSLGVEISMPVHGSPLSKTHAAEAASFLPRNPLFFSPLELLTARVETGPLLKFVPREIE